MQNSFYYYRTINNLWFLIHLLVACKIPAQESLGKDCLPEAQGGCINGNIGYPNLQAAWDKCAEVAECGFVMKYWNAKYYLRRANDPNAKKSNGIWGYKNNCPKSVQKEEGETMNYKVERLFYVQLKSRFFKHRQTILTKCF